MKSSNAILAALFIPGLLLAQATPREDSLRGWDNDKLKAEVYRLRHELQELQKKLGYSDTVEIKGKDSVKVPKEAWRADDFEAPSPGSGIGDWSVAFDQNNMGTTLDPSPYRRQEKGSPLSEGFCAGIKGHFGPNEAPWTWAFLQASLSGQGKEVDLNGFKEIWFSTKGDGRYYLATLRRAIVTDYCEFQAEFTAPERWTLVKIPLKRFNQPTWGIQHPRTFPDVKMIAFSPQQHEADYDLKVDDITFVK